ncbi:MAG: MarR family transcriptional regulator [Lachnospiraceae bacterium]|nr:MarR family transcriptional regulator [Lachnospiraceae bacterium]
MDSYTTFNHILVKLFNDIMDIEEKCIITEPFQDITNNDMHVIEAIGLGTPKNMSAIAKQLRVTTGTLTISMNSLVKKGYVKRERSEQDRRVVYIMLTAKGKLAYKHHAEFHRKMTEALVKGIDEKETKLLVQALVNLDHFFEEYAKERGI